MVVPQRAHRCVCLFVINKSAGGAEDTLWDWVVALLVLAVFAFAAFAFLGGSGVTSTKAGCGILFLSKAFFFPISLSLSLSFPWLASFLVELQLPLAHALTHLCKYTHFLAFVLLFGSLGGGVKVVQEVHQRTYSQHQTHQTHQTPVLSFLFGKVPLKPSWKRSEQRVVLAAPRENEDAVATSLWCTACVLPGHHASGPASACF